MVLIGYLISQEEVEDKYGINDKKCKYEVKEGQGNAIILEKDDVTHKLNDVLEEGYKSCEEGIEHISG